MYTVVARRWRDKRYGNTYNAVDIFDVRGEMPVLVAKLPMAYGYGDMWMQRTAKWFEDQGIVERRERNASNIPLGSNHKVFEDAGVVDYEVSDVKNKSEL